MDDLTDRNEGVQSKLVLIPYRILHSVEGFHMGRQLVREQPSSMISSQKIFFFFINEANM